MKKPSYEPRANAKFDDHWAEEKRKAKTKIFCSSLCLCARVLSGFDLSGLR